MHIADTVLRPAPGIANGRAALWFTIPPTIGNNQGMGDTQYDQLDGSYSPPSYRCLVDGPTRSTFGGLHIFGRGTTKGCWMVGTLDPHRVHTPGTQGGRSTLSGPAVRAMRVSIDRLARSSSVRA